MSETTSEQPRQINFNTLVSAIVLGVVAWVGAKTAGNNEALTQIKTQLPYMTASVSELKGQISQLVTRSELESRMAEITAKQAIIERRVLVLEFEKKKPNEP